MTATEIAADERSVDALVAAAQDQRRKTRRPIRFLVSIVVALLVCNGALLYVKQGPHVVTVDAAVARYRSASTGNGVAAVDPAALTGSTTGGDAIAAPVGGDATAAGGSPASASDRGPGGTSAGRAPEPPAGKQSPASGASGAGSLHRPVAGVYTFATTGYEETDALGGARHDYPAQTAVTIEATACGFTQRWQPLDERWDESDHCLLGNGIDIRRFTTHHEFFKKSIEQAYPCPAGSLVYDTDTATGKQWSLRCSGDAGTVEMKAHNVAWEELHIGGARVRAFHIHYDAVVTGANRGTQVQDRWFDPQSGLNVRIDSDITADSDSPFGVIHYTEHYSITAASLTPRT